MRIHLEARPLLSLALCVAALLSGHGVFASDQDDDLRVVLVVDVTDAGKKIPPATPEYPSYYYPVVRGYSPRGVVLADQKPPPRLDDVERLIAKELAKQGYWLTKKGSPPSLLLMMWWGYKAPQIDDREVQQSTVGRDFNFSQYVQDTKLDHTQQLAAQDMSNYLRQEVQTGRINMNQSLNGDEMDELVMGSSYAVHDVDQWRSDAKLLTLIQESRIPRYYVIISALDFNAAVREKKYIVYWTARVSTSLWDHSLDEVLPTLVAEMAPMLGRQTNGPRITSSLVPIGHATIGKAHMATDLTQPVAPPNQ